MPKPVTINDDRGVAVPLYEWSQADAHDPVNATLADALMRAGEATQRTGWNIKLKRSDLWQMLPALLIGPTMIAVHFVWPSAPPWSFYLVLPVIMFPILRMNARRHLREHRELFASTLLAYKRCASCGYLLDGATSDAGFVRCPECSASWEESRIGGVKMDSTTPGAGRALFAGDPFREGSNTGFLKPWSALGQWNRVASVLDANKRSLPLIGRRQLRERLAVRRGTFEADSVLRDWLRETYINAVLTTLGSSFLVMLLAYFLWSSIRRPGANSWFMLAAAAVLAGTAVPYWIAQLRRSYRGQSQSSAKHVAHVLVKNGICPTCGDDLNTERQCPCGALWPAKLNLDE